MLANLLAVPLTGLLVVPSGFLALLAVPLGLDGPLFDLMGFGIRVLLTVAHTVAALPGASLDLPPPPDAAIVLFLLGGLWWALWRAPWRHLGLLPALAGLLLALSARPPDVLLAPGARAIALRVDGRAFVEEYRRNGLRREQWRRALGVRRLEPLPKAGRIGPLACDPEACVLERGGHRLAWIRRPRALAADCRYADLLVTTLAGVRCAQGGARVLDAAFLDRAGGAALWLMPPSPRLVTVRERRGDRPWVRRPWDRRRGIPYAALQQGEPRHGRAP